MLGIAQNDAKDNEPIRVQMFETNIDAKYNWIKKLMPSSKNAMTFIAGNEIKLGDAVVIDFEKIKVYKYIRPVTNN